MAESDDAAEAAERLQAALERIAATAEQRIVEAQKAGEDATEAGARLDRLIADLRTALEGSSA